MDSTSTMRSRKSTSNVSSTVAASALSNDSSDAPSSSTTTTSSVDSSLPLSLITFNSYLFPHGLRHSHAFPNKQSRAELIRTHMRRHTCDHTCKQKEKKKEEKASTSDVADSADDANLCSGTSLLSADICCFQEVLGSLWCERWKTFFKELTKPVGVAPVSAIEGGVGTPNSNVSDGSTGSSSSSTSSLSSPEPTIDGAEFELVFSPKPSLCSGVFIDSGLMIASRYPIIHSAFRSFESNPFLMRFVDKGFQHAVIDVTQGSRLDEVRMMNENDSDSRQRRRKILHVINTHLHPHEASYSVEHGQSVRRIQVQQIRDYLLETRDDTCIPPEARFDPETSALMMAGDLNTEQSTLECEALRDILDCPYYSRIDNLEPTMHSSHPFCNHPPEQTICGDYAMGNEAIRMGPGEIIHEAVHLSDHYPVKVMFDVK